ncbi:hypothetical protein FOZ76_24840 [Verticiella sediminum]|uniref:Uncharacterized protein n=1 Tax=Verticiella sediminum TaxID=1247510 RepID=A0A556A7J9_9BURK|nr:hypothetical protein [Verticiella sediminum]TSH88864.1 hypothetical protein FOZ76_24840 [Verticiella sediminum]
MASVYLNYVFGFAVSLLLACLFVTLIAGVFLFFISWRRINDEFQHPLLKVRAFQHQPFSLKLAIYLDYFLHLVFPNNKGSGLIGNANRMLSHVDARILPLGVRWPIAGFWGGVFIGIAAMIAVWVLLFLGAGQ